MSKYIAVIPRAGITRLALVEAGGRPMAQVKADIGCDYILNSWFYNMNTGKAVGNLCIDGEVKARAGWAGYGLTWDTGPDIRMEVVPGAKAGRSYLSGVELLTPSRGPEEPASYPAEYGGKRGRSAALLAGDYLILYCSGDGTADAATPDAMREELVGIGTLCARAEQLRLLGLDSGGSSQCDFGGGRRITSPRRVAGYLCVWTKESGQEPPEQEERPVSRKTVCLDPGHGPGCVNGAPDGSYQEREFTWDMYRRIAPLLERQGVRALCTRTEDSDPSLTERAGVSNRAGADCYVSLHSNAAGNDGWYDASGLEIYTSAGPETAQRNVLASALADAFRAAGVALRSYPIKHRMYTVLAKTDAPACLIEYGFHTSKADVEKLKDSGFRDRLAEATARGLCAWLGAAWQEPAEDASGLDADVDTLAEAGVISNAGYWKAGRYAADTVAALIGRMAEFVRGVA